MANHNDFGRLGEQRAAAYLEGKGYIILERNWRLGRKEIDLICRKEDLLVVVEVKSRHSMEQRPEELLNVRKRKNLRIAADAYIKYKGIQGEVRFDLILLTGDSLEVEHIQDAIQIFD